MNYPPYSNDPDDPHSQPTTAGQYPQWGQQSGQPSYPQWGQQTPPPPQQYPQSGQNFPQYPQPGQFGAPPTQQPAKPTFKQRFRAMSPWKRFGTIGCSTIIGAIMVCSLCAMVGNALPAPPKQPSTTDAGQASPTTNQAGSIKKSTPTPEPTDTPIPTATPTPNPTPTPTPKPVPAQAPVQQQPAQQQPAQQQQPTQQPTQQSTPAPVKGVNGNPWGYNFDSNGGSLIYSPVSNFCSAGYFTCVSSFWTSTNGYVAECGNGKYTHSGGVRGACSKDSGVSQILYSH